MSNTWFSADLHLGHSNIIKYSNRPFKNIEEMNEIIIDNFNSVVKPNDKLYLLGDIAFTGRDLKEYINKLNGNKYLIRGNHDPRTFDYSIFCSVWDVRMIKVGDTSIFMSHYAHRVWPQSHYGAWHLYGHDHGTLPDNGRSTDVGVDSWKFFPVSFEQLFEKFKDIKIVHPNVKDKEEK